jgi:hypothetical protein
VGDPVSARRRREFRRLRRLLDEAAGVATEVRERSDAGGVEAFLRLEASGWKGRKGTALASRNGHAGFFREMCGEFERMGRLRVLSLEAEGRPVAMKCTVSAGDGLFYLKAAYDETFARFSPGLQLEREAVERFLADRSAGGPSWIDSCTDPANDMINRLLPDRRDLTTYVVPPKGTLARAVISGMAGVGRRSGGVRSA